MYFQEETCFIKIKLEALTLEPEPRSQALEPVSGSGACLPRLTPAIPELKQGSSAPQSCLKPILIFTLNIAKSQQNKKKLKNTKKNYKLVPFLSLESCLTRFTQIFHTFSHVAALITSQAQRPRCVKNIALSIIVHDPRLPIERVP